MGVGMNSVGGDSLGCLLGKSSVILTPNSFLNLSFRFSHLGSSLILDSNKDGLDLSANLDSNSSDLAITCWVISSYAARDVLGDTEGDGRVTSLAADSVSFSLVKVACDSLRRLYSDIDSWNT